MKNWNNLKIIEQSIKLSSKASDLEKTCQEEPLAELIHEVNLKALGIPQIIQANSGQDNIDFIEATLNVIERLRLLIEGRQELLEFARLLTEENDLLRSLSRVDRNTRRPKKTSRLSIKDRSRIDPPLHVNIGVQGRLF